MWEAGMAKRDGIAGEPRLEELLADPILRLLLRADRVAEAELRRVIERARDARMAGAER
jgi:hypothetical protein